MPGGGARQRQGSSRRWVPAARWRRWVGSAVDGAMVSTLTLVAGAAGVGRLAGFAVGVAVVVAMTWRPGATPGKLLVGTRVVRADGGGHPELWASAIRWALLSGLSVGSRLLGLPVTVLWIVWVLSMVNALLVLASPDGRGLHDHVADTIVIDTRGGVSHGGRR
ncbi:MAG: RDD family protein [Ilumatobacteraceae bacterium]|nr:RDD family protein [Ilumatobacteraceae bacterium]